MVGHSDLVVTAVPNPPGSVRPSAAFTLAPTVENDGTDPAPASTTSFFLVNSGTGAKKNLAAGDTAGACQKPRSTDAFAQSSLTSSATFGGRG